MTSRQFDLVLSYPQWQGSGRSKNLPLGAEYAADVCGRYGPLLRVPQAGEGEARHGVNHWTAIVEQFRAAQSLLSERRPKRLLTAGGDCACDIAVIDHLHRQYSDLTVLWIDAHLDANTVATTPSGNFHGMPVAALMGSAPPEMQGLLSAPLSPRKFRYVSAHVGDSGDWSFQRDNNLQWLEADYVPSGPVHIHFDLDALDPIGFPHVAYPDGCMAQDAALRVVQDVARHGSLVGLTITEFAPADREAATAGSDFVGQLCKAATL